MYRGSFPTDDDIVSHAAAWWYYLKRLPWLTEEIWQEAEYRAVRDHQGKGGFLFDLGHIMPHLQDVRQEHSEIRPMTPEREARRARIEKAYKHR